MTQDKQHIKGIEINLYSRDSQSSSTLNTDLPFALAILGDFSTSEKPVESDTAKQANYRPIFIDRDNVDDVLESLNVIIKLEFNHSNSQTIQIPISNIDDFHPDNLYKNVKTFDKFRELRNRIKQSDSFNTATSEILGLLKDEETPTSDKQDKQTQQPEQVTNLLDQVIDNTDSSHQNTTQSSSSLSVVDEIIKDIASKYVLPAKNPKQQELLDVIDHSITEHMRSILHHPCFQKVEATWKSVQFLCKRIETDNNLKLFLIDISKPALHTALTTDTINRSQIFKQLRDKHGTELNWAALLGNYTFTLDKSDVDLLSNAGKLAEQFNCSFLASAHTDLLQCLSDNSQDPSRESLRSTSESDTNLWNNLRTSKQAEHIALTYPRFLLRMPYGEETSPIDSFEFEEFADEPCHECYLWGNGGFIVALLMAQSFSNNGWNMQLGDQFEVDNLPLCYFMEDGEKAVKPCSEIYLYSDDLEHIANAGLIALTTARNSNNIRISSFRSIALSGTPVTGPWIETRSR